MINYDDKLVYLDMQKSGSSYVRQFLLACCSLPLKHYDQHGRIRADYDPRAYHFITIRHPFALYVSLFRYGLSGEGLLRFELTKRGYEDLYQPNAEAFEHWMAFMLDDENARALGESFKDVAGRGFGFQTFRFLALSFAEPIKKLQTVSDYSGVVALYEQSNILDKVIRNESLSEELRDLATRRAPQFFDQAKAESFLNKRERVNASSTQLSVDYTLSPALMQRFEEKERFLLDRFYS